MRACARARARARVCVSVHVCACVHVCMHVCHYYTGDRWVAVHGMTSLLHKGQSGGTFSVMTNIRNFLEGDKLNVYNTLTNVFAGVG